MKLSETKGQHNGGVWGTALAARQFSSAKAAVKRGWTSINFFMDRQSVGRSVGGWVYINFEGGGEKTGLLMAI